MSQWSGKLRRLCMTVCLEGCAYVYLWRFCKLGPHKVKMRPWCPYDFISYCTLKTTSLHILKLTVSWRLSMNSFHIVQYSWSTVTFGDLKEIQEMEGSILNLENARSSLSPWWRKINLFLIEKIYGTLRLKSQALHY